MTKEKRMTVRLTEQEVSMLEELKGYYARLGVSSMSDSMVLRSAIHNSYLKALREDKEMKDIREIR